MEIILYYIKSLIFSYYLKKSNFLNICASDTNYKYKELSWAFYKLGMYNSALSSVSSKKNFRVLSAKAVSAANIGNRDDASFYLNTIKDKYPEQQFKLILPLSTYFPEYAFSLLDGKKVENSAIYYYLYCALEGKEKTRLNYSSELRRLLDHSVDFRLFYSNVLVDNHSEKLTIFNEYLRSFGLRNIDFKSITDGFCVKNLTSKSIDSFSKRVPLVSILIPAYNVKDRIESCVKSLVMQDYSNIEIIVIDDASTDGTDRIIRELEKDYSQVRGIFLPINVGPFVAKTYAAEHAKGEFITTQDADDWAHPERISRQIKPLLENKNLVATVSQLIRVDDYGNFYAKQLMPLTRFNPSSFMFRKDQVIKKTGLWDLVRIAADTEFIERLKLIFGDMSVSLIKLPLIVGAHRQNSLMTSSETGNLNDRMSPTRLDYWESWRFWHIEHIRAKKVPVMPKMNQYRPQFLIPDSMLVPENTLKNIDNYGY